MPTNVFKFLIDFPHLTPSSIDMGANLDGKENKSMWEYLMQEEKETQMKRKEMIKNDEENHYGDEQQWALTSIRWRFKH